MAAVLALDFSPKGTLCSGLWRCMIYFQLLIILLLIGLNGFLAMSELAVVASRRSRLRLLVARAVAGADRALALNSDPGRFLSTVQTGITLIGILSGAYSGATVGAQLSDVLVQAGMANGLAQAIGVGSVVAVITYVSLIFGELVPKQFALSNPERVAVQVAPVMLVLARFSRPVVWVLDRSARFVLSFGSRRPSDHTVSDEDVKAIILEAESAGVLEAGERKMISGVMRLSDRAVRGVMTPRTDVDWLTLSDAEAEIRADLLASRHSRLPVAETADGPIVGIVQARDLLANLLNHAELNIAAQVRRAPIVLDSAGALDVLTALQTSEVPMALVHDEYGHFEGIVTPGDLLAAIAGTFRSDRGEDELVIRRRDGSWLLPGSMPADEMAEQLGILLPEPRDYETVGGLVISHLQRLPAVGDMIEAFGFRFEVVALDGRRIERVLASRRA
jgi:putative hemolysin